MFSCYIITNIWRVWANLNSIMKISYIRETVIAIISICQILDLNSCEVMLWMFLHNWKELSNDGYPRFQKQNTNVVEKLEIMYNHGKLPFPNLLQFLFHFHLDNTTKELTKSKQQSQSTYHHLPFLVQYLKMNSNSNLNTGSNHTIQILHCFL